MEELGISRMDTLPMEDRPKGAYGSGSTRHIPPAAARQAVDTQRRTKTRNFLAATWQAAIQEGAFQDDDAATVENLDTMYDGQLHRIARGALQDPYQVLRPDVPAPKPGFRRTADGKFGTRTFSDGRQFTYRLDAHGNIPPSARPVAPRSQGPELHKMDMTKFGNGPLPLTFEDYHRDSVKIAQQKETETVAVTKSRKPAPETKAQQVQDQEQPRKQTEASRATPSNPELIDLAPDNKTRVPRPDQSSIIKEYPIEFMPAGPRRQLSSTAYICSEAAPKYGRVVIIVGSDTVDDIEHPVAQLEESFHADGELLSRWEVASGNHVTHCFIFKNSSQLKHFVTTLKDLKERSKQASIKDKQAPVVNIEGTAGTSEKVSLPLQEKVDHKKHSLTIESQGLVDTTPRPSFAAKGKAPTLSDISAKSPVSCVDKQRKTTQSTQQAVTSTVTPVDNESRQEKFNGLLSDINPHSKGSANVSLPPEMPMQKTSQSIPGQAHAGQATEGDDIPIDETLQQALASTCRKIASCLRAEGFEFTSSLAKTLVYQLLLQASSTFRELDTITKERLAASYFSSMPWSRHITYTADQALSLRVQARPPPCWLGYVPFLPGRVAVEKSRTESVGQSSNSGAQSSRSVGLTPHAPTLPPQPPGQQEAPHHGTSISQDLRSKIEDIAQHLHWIHLSDTPTLTANLKNDVTQQLGRSLKMVWTTVL
ncbi:hypothetical protein NKR23_g871 [Pleurostoma richardsiae]|uniref:Uncharacterized protein n=1 Tax=Pleurostoma richardsiae TaxID=41990 RepID=A0AA38SDH5_9PEZI|nr:hypothetical protein NKR23_g871 [Pleurostoma richardsiae]